jgi:aromatic amino acid aminotransferase I
MDGQGLRSDDLERILSTWDTARPNEKRPKLLYIVPVGSNPTGSTMPATRRKEIYDLAVKYGSSLPLLSCLFFIYTDAYFGARRLYHRRRRPLLRSPVPSLRNHRFAGRTGSSERRGLQELARAEFPQVRCRGKGDQA